ncbi:MAG: transposase [Proteobacteria bacterium]|nr:transposase [Pseudomonadota bacterium]
MKGYSERKKTRLSRPAYRQPNVFSLTITTNNRYPWFRLHPELADSGVQLLRHIGASRGTMLYAWCIMPDHIHLLLRDNDIVDFVRLFKGKMTPTAFAREPGRRLWQRSFYDHALRKEESLSEIALYIWGNPVRAGIIDGFSNYAWSGSEVWPNWREF